MTAARTAAADRGPNGPTEAGQPAVPLRLWRSRPVRWSAVCGLLLAAGFIADRSGAAGWAVTGLYGASTLAGVRFFAIEAAAELWEDHRVDIELLMTIAAVVAGLLGLWGEAATLAFLYSISEALEEFTEDRTRGAIRALMDLAPTRVQRLDDTGGIVEVGIEELAVGDRFLVRPGAAVATDGQVVEGTSAVDEAAVTGEPIPVDKAPGDAVFAGTLNAHGALVVRATAAAGDNTLAKIVRLVAEAQERKGRGEQFMNRFARRYSPAVLAAGVLVAAAGGTVTGDWSAWLIRGATVLVAAAPCALVISIPVTYVAAIGRAGRRGVLIKGGVHLESLADVRVVALDKTGTLTAGRPHLVAVHPVDGVSDTELLSAAAAVEARSEHPLARAVRAGATDARIGVADAGDFTALPGAGAQARVDGRDVIVGSPALLREHQINIDAVASVVTGLRDDGSTAVLVAVDGQLLGVLGIADTVRAGAWEALAALRRLGIDRVVMLTGDNARTAAVVARAVGADEYRADLRPADKATEVARLQADIGHVAMVGDGVNDAPALAAAQVGIAMGAAGSDVALETADVALMSDDLGRLNDALRIGRRTRRIVRQNLTLSLLILAVLVPGALLGVFTLPVAVLAHETSELLVISNGLRAARA